MTPWPEQSPTRRTRGRQLRGNWSQSRGIWLLFVSLLFGASPIATQAREIEPDICKDIPGETLARAVSGQLKETKSLSGRCVYSIASKDTPEKMDTFVIYRHPADDFSALKEAEEGKGEVLEGVGDAATLTFDKDAKRFWLLVTKHKHVTLQISGEDREAVRKIAIAVMRAYTTR